MIKRLMQLQHGNKMFLYRWKLTLVVLFHLFSRIYGIYKGTMAKTPNPFAAVVKEDTVHGYYLCSAAIIAQDWVLTHTSCILKLRGKVVVIVDMINVNYPGITSDIKDVLINEHYDAVQDIKNIALVQTKKKIVGPRTRPVNITTKKWANPSACILYGFGQASYNDTRIEDRNITYGILHSGPAKNPTYKERCGCLEDKQFNKTQKEDYICNNQGKGRVCIGDFGAPLVCGSGANEEVVAVAHNFFACPGYDDLAQYMGPEFRGTSCGHEQSTDIYTYLFPYRKWILDRIKKKKDISLSYSYANYLPMISKWLLISPLYYTFCNL